MPHSPHPLTATPHSSSSLRQSPSLVDRRATPRLEPGRRSPASSSPPRPNVLPRVFVAHPDCSIAVDSLATSPAAANPSPSPSSAFFAAELAAAAASSSAAPLVAASKSPRKGGLCTDHGPLSSDGTVYLDLPCPADLHSNDVYPSRLPRSPAAGLSSSVAVGRPSSHELHRHQKAHSLSSAHCPPATSSSTTNMATSIGSASPTTESAASSYLVPGSAGYGLGLINSNEPYPSPLSSSSSPHFASCVPSRAPSPYGEMRVSVSSLSSRACIPSPITVPSSPVDQLYSRSPVLGSALTLSTPSFPADEPPVYGLNSGSLLVPASKGHSARRSSVSGGHGGRSFGWGASEETLSMIPLDSPKGLKKSGRPANEFGSLSTGAGSVLGWPVAVLHFLLGPFFFFSVTTPGALSRDGSISRPVSAGPLWLRLLGVVYVALSLVIFTKACIGTIWNGAGTEGWVDRRRSEGVAGARQVVLAGAASAWGRLESWRGSNIPIEPIEQPWDMEVAVRRKWLDGALNAEVNPLSGFNNTYRFSKMHSKVASAFSHNVEPYIFPAFGGPLAESKGTVTACMYTNDIWASEISGFVKRWGGPVSLIWETMASRHDVKARSEVLKRIAKLRETDSMFKSLVDVHLVSTPSEISSESLERRRQSMVVDPTASNAQMNTARMFARTSMVWMAGDARLVPSHNLRSKLNGEGLKRQVLERGDAIVVPSFGWARSKQNIKAPAEIREENPRLSFKETAQLYVQSHRETLPITGDKWPKTKRAIVGLTMPNPVATMDAGIDNNGVVKQVSSTGPLLMMHDKSWDLGKGPSNWSLWRKPSTDPRLMESPEVGGGAGLGISGGVGGGNALYRVMSYDLHYSPYLVISKEGQPWCTERFERNGAACTYQMYLTGTELWVVPDAWVFTLQSMEKSHHDDVDESEKLKSSISSRLYTKFHQEACMHFGREFLSIGLWSGTKARHLRIMCSTVLQSWGVGVQQEPDDVPLPPAAAAPPALSTSPTSTSTLMTSKTTKVDAAGAVEGVGEGSTTVTITAY